MVSPDEPGYDLLISTIFDTMATAAEMNAKGWLTPEEVHGYLRRITGREVDPSTTLLPPFYVDMPKTLEEVQASEMKYLRACQKDGVWKTDMSYLWRIVYTILFKKARSH